MKFLGSIFVCLAMFLSANAFSRSTFPPPTFQCKSTDGLFRLDVHSDLSVIRVFDLGQNRFSHSIRNLDFKESSDNIVEVSNPAGENDLREGLIMVVNLNYATNNGFLVDENQMYNCSK